MYPPQEHKQKNFFYAHHMKAEGYLLLEVMISLVILVGFAMAFAAHQVTLIKQQSAMIQYLKAIDYAHDMLERILFLHELPPMQYQIDGIALQWERRPLICYKLDDTFSHESEHILVTATWYTQTGDKKQYCLNSTV